MTKEQKDAAEAEERARFERRRLQTREENRAERRRRSIANGEIPKYARVPPMRH
jgi:hypothetical protein